MRIVIVPSTGWEQSTNVVLHHFAQAWASVAPKDFVHEIALSDGSTGFSHETEDTVYIEAGTLVRASQPLSITRGSSYALGVELAELWLATTRRIVLGFDPVPGSVPWADAGAGLLAGLLDTMLDKSSSDVAPGTAAGGVAEGRVGLAPTRLLGGGLGLLGVTSEDLPNLADLRGELVRNPIVVASRAAEPLLGLEGLAASLADSGHLDQNAAHDLERAIGDFVHAVAGALGPSLLGRNLLGVGEGGPDPRTDADPSIRARELASAAGASTGGGAAFMLNVLGAQLANAFDVTAEREGLDGALDAADMVLVVAPSLDAEEMNDGVTVLIAARAMERAVPVVVLAGDSDAGRREWKALGVSALYEPTVPLAHGVTQEETLRALLERIPGIARTWSR